MKKQFILVAVLSFIILGLGFINFVEAIGGVPISGTPIGLEGEPSISIDIKDYNLGITNVGTLPTSNFYFLKKWKRGITRLFTFGSVAKAQLELNITNQIAAEVFEVEKENPDNIKAIGNALQNYTKAQDRLNIRIAGLSDTSSNPNIASLLKEVDDKTSKHIALLEQLNTELVGDLTKAKENTDKILVATVEKGNDALALKQKAEDQIKKTEVSINESKARYNLFEAWPSIAVSEEANNALMGVSTTRSVAIENNSSIFDRWGSYLIKAESNLDDAKKAFSEGKYGEAYGQARSALAMVPVLATGDNFPGKKVDVIVPTTPSAETKMKLNTNDNKEPAKVLENNLPLPTEQKPIEQKDEPRLVPTATESTSVRNSTGF